MFWTSHPWLLMNHTDWLSLLHYPFMQRAITGGILMGLLGGLLGSFVTLRQLSFFSHVVGHAAFVGLIMGVILQIEPTWMLMPFTLIFGLGVLYLIERTNLASDNILSISLSGALAAGVILSSFVDGYRGNLMNALFGDILAIHQVDLILLVLLVFGSSIFLFSTLQQQILLTLNPAVAQVQGVPIHLYRYIFVALLSLTVAVSTKAVGALLVNAFLVIPASTAKLLSHQFYHFLGLCIAIGALSSVLGMTLSGSVNWASGPSIVLVQFLAFLLALATLKLGRKSA